MKHSSAMEVMQMELSQATIDRIKKPINPDLIKKSRVNAYGSGQYLDVETYKRLMNEIFGYRWSWEIINYELITPTEGKAYVQVLGRLTVPGIGIKEAYGSQPLDKQDKSQTAKAASAYAFKNACRMCGVGDIDEGNDAELFDEEPAPKQHQVINTPVETPKAATYDPKSLERMKAFKNKYGVGTDNSLLIPYIRAWSGGQLRSPSDIKPHNIDNFLDWAEKNATTIEQELEM